MRSKNFLFTTLAAIVFLTATGALAQDETITNEDVISLIKSGLASSVIIDKIGSSKTKFDVSTDALIKLKQAGVSDDVVAMMVQAKSGRPGYSDSVPDMSKINTGDVNDPLAGHNVGIYLYTEKDGQKKMSELEPNATKRTRIDGLLTAVMTSGIAKTRIKTSLPGTEANLEITDPQPVFYFYLNQKDRSMSALNYFPASVNQFQLVRFEIKGKSREVTVGKAGLTGIENGVADSAVTDFRYEKVSDGIYKITIKQPLKNGQYGFYLLNPSSGTDAVGETFFDFGIRVTP